MLRNCIAWYDFRVLNSKKRQRALCKAALSYLDKGDPLTRKCDAYTPCMLDNAALHSALWRFLELRTLKSYQAIQFLSIQDSEIIARDILSKDKNTGRRYHARQILSALIEVSEIIRINMHV
jgi:hypothetical protein